MERGGVWVPPLPLHQKQLRVQGVGGAFSAPVCSLAKDTTLCHMFAAKNIHYLLQHICIELLLHSRLTPDTEEHIENR